MRIAALLACGLLGACGISPYAANGVLRDTDVGPAALRAAGCLDLALDLRPAANEDDNALLVARFGNRCMRPAAFDLGSAVITAFDEDGRSRRLHFFDPRGELALLHVDAGMSGTEKVRVTGAGYKMKRICFDVTRVLPAATQPIAPVCFRATEDATWEVAS